MSVTLFWQHFVGSVEKTTLPELHWTQNECFGSAALGPEPTISSKSQELQLLPFLMLKLHALVTNMLQINKK